MIDIEIHPPDRSHEPVDFGAPYEPPAGRLLHGWGQIGVEDRPHNVEDEELVLYEAVVEPAPATISTYAHVHDTTPTILDAFCEGVGRLVAKYPTSALIIGLHVRPVEKVVVKGECDESLRKLARRLKELRIPAFLRIGYEYNLTFDPHDPDYYPEMFRHIVELFRAEGADNVASTWCAAAGSFPHRDFRDWWPGADVVDWAAVDVFAPIGFGLSETTDFLDQCRDWKKPVMIPESCPLWFDWSRVDTSKPETFRDGLLEPGSAEDQWAWYAAMFELVRRRPEIKSLTVIAADWSTGPYPFYGNTLIDAWDGLPERYNAALADPRFMHLPEAQTLFGLS